MSISCKLALSLCVLSFSWALSGGEEVSIPKSPEEDTEGIMSQKYWEIWNGDVQRKIDADIDANRKSDAEIRLNGVPEGAVVEVEQLSHDFIFGANIFNFDQLGSKDSNARYKSLFGTLFNSATVAFYWAPLEMKLGEPRFDSEFWDSEEFWNNVKYPKLQPHWRRPAVGNIVDFCLDKNIRIHGHPLVWGNRKWHYPEKMIFDKFASPEEMAFFKKYSKNNLDCSTYAFSEEYKKMPQSELEKRFGNISKAMAELIEIRVREIAKRFADKVDSWDVVNESSEDFAAGVLIPGSGASKSRYGIMEADYAFNAFRLAQKYLPKSAALNINDYNMKPDYVKQVEDLKRRGCKIDIVGSQMHIFNPDIIRRIAAGENVGRIYPNQIDETINLLSALNLPIHMSEITIAAPDETLRGRMMQAIIARNAYRKWFSAKNVMGITWWNVVDGCGAPGEPLRSGLFTYDMSPKPAYYALNSLINGEWKTRVKVRADSDGKVKFRGFRGLYRLSWSDTDGSKKSFYYNLK